MPRLPAKGPQPGGLERVAPVVPWPVLNRADQRLVGARQLQDAGGEVAVLDLLAAANVVDPAGLAFPQDELDPGAVVLDMQPVAGLTAVAVDGERLAVASIRDEERGDLLRVLVGPVRVGAAGDRSGEDQVADC